MLRRIGNAAGFGSTAAAVSGSSSEQGNPLELISFNTATKKFELGTEALDVLRKISGPVAVVAVSGRARQGKSFILNQLLGRSTGFVVGPTVRPCTKGLWMWSTPIKRQAADGSPYHLVLLDTEGIDAYDQTGQYSTQIFSLAVLLCSYFVYNQIGGIDEASLDRLSLVTEVTKHIRVRSGSAGGESAQDLASFTPAFLWLLRDFYLALEDDGRAISSSEYLETALRPLRGAHPAVEAKNQIRRSIMQLFPDRDCFCLVRPVSDERQLQNLDSVPASQLRPEFRQGLERLTELIFSKAQPKRLGNQVVTGGMLAGLATAYVDAINGGAVPTIATAWQGVSETECRRAADAALAAYIGAFRENVAPEEGTLEAEHRRAMEAGHRVYQAAAVGDQPVRDANSKRFSDAADARFKGLRERVLANAALQCEQLIGAATLQLTQLCREESTTLESLQEALAVFDRKYTATAVGPAKWKRHAEFMRDSYAACVRDLALRTKQRATQEAAAAANRLQLAQTALQQAEVQVKHVQTAAMNASVRAETAERQLTEARNAAETARREGRLSVEQGAAAVRAESQLQLQLLRASHEAAMAEAQTAASSATRRLVELQSLLDQANAELASRRSGEATASSISASLQARVYALEQSAAEAQHSLQAVAAERDAANASRLQAESRAASLQLEVQDLTTRAAIPVSAAMTPPPRARTTVPAAPPVEASPTDADMLSADDGEDALDPAIMTIAEIKAWLTDNEHEGAVWEMTQSKAKKAKFVEFMRSVM